MNKQEFIERWARNDETIEGMESELDQVISQAITQAIAERGADQRRTAMKTAEKIKKLACSFFRYFWNEGGTNAEDAFDNWAETEIGKHLIKSIAEYGQWKKYPENKPEKQGKYEVCFTDGSVEIDKWIGTSQYEPHWDWFGKWDFTEQGIIAFRELPKPYQPQEGGEG